MATPARQLAIGGSSFVRSLSAGVDVDGERLGRAAAAGRRRRCRCRWSTCRQSSSAFHCLRRRRELALCGHRGFAPRRGLPTARFRGARPSGWPTSTLRSACWPHGVAPAAPARGRKLGHAGQAVQGSSRSTRAARWPPRSNDRRESALRRWPGRRFRESPAPFWPATLGHFQAEVFIDRRASAAPPVRCRETH